MPFLRAGKAATDKKPETKTAEGVSSSDDMEYVAKVREAVLCEMKNISGLLTNIQLTLAGF